MSVLVCSESQWWGHALYRVGVPWESLDGEGVVCKGSSLLLPPPIVRDEFASQNHIEYSLGVFLGSNSIPHPPKKHFKIPVVNFK